MPVCQYCNSNMSTMGSLINHQKRTKRCLIIQGITPKGEFKCPRCTSTFLTKVSLASHTIACNKKHLAETNANIVIQNKIQELENIENIKQNNLLQAEKIVSLEINLFNMETKYNMLIEEEKTLQDNYNMLIEEEKTLQDNYNMLQEEKKQLILNTTL